MHGQVRPKEGYIVRGFLVFRFEEVEENVLLRGNVIDSCTSWMGSDLSDRLPGRRREIRRDVEMRTEAAEKGWFAAGRK
jgi:hypothetical protein